MNKIIVYSIFTSSLTVVCKSEQKSVQKKMTTFGKKMTHR